MKSGLPAVASSSRDGIAIQLLQSRLELPRSPGRILAALGKQGRVAVVKVDVVRRRPACFKANGLSHHKGHGLGFGFAYRLGGGGAAFGFVQHSRMPTKCSPTLCRQLNFAEHERGSITSLPRPSKGSQSKTGCKSTQQFRMRILSKIQTRNRLSIAMSRTNHASYHSGQAALAK